MTTRVPVLRLLPIIVVGLACTIDFEVRGDEAIMIGSRRELFVDHRLIAKLDGIALRMHEPRPSGVALKFDRPWEGPFSGYVTILQDGDVHRMYYRGLPELVDFTDAECTCYAESTDGIHWVKPELELYEVFGTRKNNVILHGEAPASHNFAPFVDTRPGAPADERFKAVGGSESSGLLAYASPDGIHWRRWGRKPILTGGAFDSQNVVFWSEAEKCYVCYFRVYTDVRSIARATSADFATWSKPEIMEFGQAPHEHLYTNQTFPYPRASQLYVSLPMRYFANRKVLDDATFDALPIHAAYRPHVRQESTDGVLMTSRGGNRYDRTFLEAFMRPGLDPGNWVSRSVMAARGLVQTGPTEMSIYYQQHDGQPSAHLRRFSLRLDGFASAYAGHVGGELLTTPVTFSGGELEINFSTSAGGCVQVEIQDADGVPLPGYAVGECPEMIGDAVERIVSWKSGSDVSKLAGKTVRLRFVMRDADLYSFRFR